MALRTHSTIGCFWPVARACSEWTHLAQLVWLFPRRISWTRTWNCAPLTLSRRRSKFRTQRPLGGSSSCPSMCTVSQYRLLRQGCFHRIWLSLALPLSSSPVRGTALSRCLQWTSLSFRCLCRRMPLAVFEVLMTKGGPRSRGKAFGPLLLKLNWKDLKFV